MNNYEIHEVTKPPRRKLSANAIWNILTLVALVAMLCVLSGYLLIYFNPYGGFNPFPPPPPTATVILPTSTAVPKITIVPSWTPTNVPAQLNQALEASATPTILTLPTETPTVESTPIPTLVNTFSFELQAGSPAALASTDFNPDSGCDWLGVAGQATSLSGEAVKGIFVQLGGSLPGEPDIDKLTMTGLATQYGQGGFELILGNSPVDSQGTLWVQLLDQQNLPLSDRYYFDTYNDCKKNLIIFYFIQVR